MASFPWPSSSSSRGGPSWRASPSSPVEYVPVGFPPRSLLDQLLGEMQGHLQEMERMRLVLTEAYPRLGCWMDPEPRRHQQQQPRWERIDMEPREGGGGYRFSLEVAGFLPEEMAVKVNGRKLTVSAKHDKRSESADGCLSHEYREVRKELLLPDDANLQALTCCFSPDEGRLHLEAPRMALPPTEAKAIPITICKGPEAGTPTAPAKEPLPSASPEKGATSK
ncbi:heat shock protein 30C-like [Sceloporus undulatus]|uniref:heat shock protein 30C-like n=1 Tax=Sceloporus undulatus TaxID=8520 RepID=UPI001C4D73CB|nr:heat shock protein 30C-like [Sceloporus undulatus]